MLRTVFFLNESLNTVYCNSVKDFCSVICLETALKVLDLGIGIIEILNYDK